jgi:hypothetical protein
MARVAAFDTKKAELVAQKMLAQHSPRMKMALSELVLQTIEDLRSPEVRPKDRALAMVALKTVSNQLYGWDREPDLPRMKRAGASHYSEDDMKEDFTPTGAVNLRLINTTPEQLAKMAEAKGKFNRDGPEDVGATECNGQAVRSSAIAPEQPPVVTHGPPIPKKEAPKPPLDNQPAQTPSAGRPPISEKSQKPPDWSQRINPAPLSQTAFGQTRSRD